MKRLTTNALGLIFVLTLIAPGAIWAADNSGGTINTPNNDAYTTAPTVATPPSATSDASAKPHKHHRKHKKTTAKISATNTGAAAGSQVPNSMSNSYGTDNPGGPNMGPPDHVPGTTGTSGQ